MGREISLFPSYSQKENRVTNYTILMLKIIYESDLVAFAEIVSGLLDHDVSEFVGMQFRQQENASHGGSVPDALISQKPFSLYIETKTHDRFGTNQLERHWDEVRRQRGGLHVLLALGKFEGKRDIDFSPDDEGDEHKFSISSFDDFADLLREKCPSDASQWVDEYIAYLEHENLLSSWRCRLDVVNCGRSKGSVIEKKVYTCPAKGGSYQHRRSKYFGVYKDKTVSHVAEILMVADVDEKGDILCLWCNSDSEADCEKYEEEIKNKLEKGEIEGYRPIRVFLLGEFYDTNFQKDSRGGMMGLKTYFDVSSLRVSNAEELALKLCDKDWSHLRQ